MCRLAAALQWRQICRRRRGRRCHSPARGAAVGGKARGGGKRRAGNRGAAGFSRRESRLSRGDARRHPVARGRVGGGKHPRGRSGAERVFHRIGQEYASRIHTVDVVNYSDAAHFIVWKREGMLEPYLPEDVAKYYPAEHKDPDGTFASYRAWVCVIGYNTNMVKAEDAPKSYADLLDPKWTGKIVKAHPSYSGTIMTATYQMSRDLGWEYFEKLAKQRVMQVQSSADPPKKLALGERAVMADGNEYNIFIEKDKGTPVEIVYATEGSPVIVGPNGLFKNAPNPNAARLFQSFCFSPEAQQLCIDAGGLRSVHPQTKDKPGRKPFGEIKKMKDDPEAVERMRAEIKARYSKLFGA